MLLLRATEKMDLPLSFNACIKHGSWNSSFTSQHATSVVPGSGWFPLSDPHTLILQIISNCPRSKKFTKTKFNSNDARVCLFSKNQGQIPRAATSCNNGPFTNLRHRPLQRTERLRCPAKTSCFGEKRDCRKKTLNFLQMKMMKTQIYSYRQLITTLHVFIVKLKTLSSTLKNNTFQQMSVGHIF